MGYFGLRKGGDNRAPDFNGYIKIREKKELWRGGGKNDQKSIE